MSRACDLDELVALAAGELDPDAAERRAAHAAGCAACAGELAWLRTERHLMDERRRSHGPLPDSLWNRIEERIGSGTRARGPARRWAGRRAVALGIAAAAAAALALFWLWPRDENQSPPSQVVAPADRPPADAPRRDLGEAERAVAEAERAHLAAIDALERAYAERRARLDPALASSVDQKLRQTREEFERQRRTTGGDLDSRLLLLDAYATHRRSLLATLQEIEGSP